MNFIKKDNNLFLKYFPENSIEWMKDKFKKNEKIRLKHLFHLGKNHLYTKDDFETYLEESSGEILFKIGDLKGKYYKIDKDILNISVNLFIHKKIRLDKKIFLATRNISIFGKIAHYIKEDIYIGDDESGNFPIKAFEELISKFPTTYELNLYAEYRIHLILKNYFDNLPDISQKYEKYLNKRSTYKGDNLLTEFSHFEKEKYSKILEKLKFMLKKEKLYNEKQWQKEILQIILLIYPKYISIFEEVAIKDINNKNRRLDYLLLNSNGSIDIIEIKRPAQQKIITEGIYRDNYIPLRELSGTVMQIEKYIYYLNKWGIQGEKELIKRYRDGLPEDFRIKIINPQAIIIMGRDNNLTEEQKDDFEIIKRQYRNVLDIITYDELILRIENIINKYN